MTIQIQRRVLWSKLLNADEKITRGLYAYMGIKMHGAEFSPKFKSHSWDGKVRFFRRLSGTFPAGLEDIVLQYLNDKRIAYEIVEKRNVPQSIEPRFDLCGGIELRDFQKTAIRNALQRHTGIIWAACNSGKTEIAASIILSINAPTVFLTHRKELFLQTVERLSKRLNIPISEIGIFATQDVAKQLGHKKQDGPLGIRIKPITVAMIQSLASKGKREQATKFLKTRQVLIADECHIMPAQTWRTILTACPAYYRFGLSGTAMRNDTERIRNWTLQGFLGPVIARVRNTDLIEQGFSSPVVINMVQFDARFIISDYDTARNEGIIFNEARNAAIEAVVLANKGKSILVVVNYIDHGDVLQDRLIDVDPTTEFTSGQETTERRIVLWTAFKKREITCLITSPILDVGVDTDVIDVLVLAAGGKSDIQLLQRIGRGLRVRAGKTLAIYDFVDEHNGYLLEHTLRRLDTYKDEQFERQFVSVSELSSLIE